MARSKENVVLWPQRSGLHFYPCWHSGACACTIGAYIPSQLPATVRVPNFLHCLAGFGICRSCYTGAANLEKS